MTLLSDNSLKKLLAFVKEILISTLEKGQIIY